MALPPIAPYLVYALSVWLRGKSRFFLSRILYKSIIRGMYKIQSPDGTKVFDLPRVFPGSFISLMLPDFGAEVIMVEHPEGEPGCLRLVHSGRKFQAGVYGWARYRILWANRGNLKALFLFTCRIWPKGALKGQSRTRHQLHKHDTGILGLGSQHGEALAFPGVI